LFVNSDPGAFTRPPTPELRAAIDDPGPYRVVPEFTERALATNPTGLLDVARSVHQAGNALALDDVGAEPLSLALLPLIEPETVKLDMQLLRDLYSAHTITTAAGVGAFAERTGAAILAEGIEIDQDRVRALGLGATWAQGWLYGRPGPLDALAGRPINSHARLRPFQPGLHRPAGTAFTTAAARCPARLADIRTATAFVEHLLRDATLAGEYGVLLAHDDDPAGFTTWLSRFMHVAPSVGLAGMISSADNDDLPAGIRHATARPSHPGLPEAAVVMVSPDKLTALCIRYRQTPGDVDLILTHDAATVLELARMLLGHLGTRLGIHETVPMRVLR
jgi:hypothetical protein